MSPNSFSAAQRRIAFKQRAKIISSHFFLPILFAVILYTWPMQLISTLLSNIPYTGPVLVLENLGLSVPIVREVLILLVTFLEAPLLLSLYSYLISLDREQPLSCFSVFSWLSEGAKLYSAAKYALFEIALSLLLFPLERIPMLALVAGMEKYAEDASELMESVQNGAASETLIAEMLSGNNQRTLLFALLALGMLIKSAVAAVPFICAMDSESQTGFFSKLRLALHCIKGHYVEYVILQITLLGWYFLASLMGDYLCVLVYPYILMTLAIFFDRLIISKTRPAPEKPEGEKGADSKEKTEEDNPEER